MNSGTSSSVRFSRVHHFTEPLVISLLHSSVKKEEVAGKLMHAVCPAGGGVTWAGANVRRGEKTETSVGSVYRDIPISNLGRGSDPAPKMSDEVTGGCISEVRMQVASLHIAREISGWAADIAWTEQDLW
jgi:hypothetical protein